MHVANGTTAVLTRYYIGGRYELDTPSNTERLYLGGDAYSAPAVYMKEGNNWNIYYICRDYLGSITHIADVNGEKLYEYSYALNNQLSYIDKDGKNPFLIAGLVIFFFYLKTAHDKTPKQDQGDLRKWKWNPLSWNKPDSMV